MWSDSVVLVCVAWRIVALLDTPLCQNVVALSDLYIPLAIHIVFLHRNTYPDQVTAAGDGRSGVVCAQEWITAESHRDL